MTSESVSTKVVTVEKEKKAQLQKSQDGLDKEVRKSEVSKLTSEFIICSIKWIKVLCTKEEIKEKDQVWERG